MNIVYNCDCMEYMKTLPDKYFELAIVDPPYGINQDGGGYNFGVAKKTNYIKKEWDAKTPDDFYFKELFRISRNQIICGGNYMTQYLPITKSWIVWDKIGELKCNNLFSDCELLWTSLTIPTKKITIIQQGFIRDDKSERIHPTQKPIALYKWLLQNYAKPNDKIFDSHLGSGSSRIAAYELGFDFVGCELDKDYFEAQEERFKLEKAKIDNEFYLHEENNLFNFKE